MVSSLVRWFVGGAGSGHSGRGPGSPRRFAPRLEALEDRAVPSGVNQDVSRAVLLGTRPGSDSALLGGGTRPGTEIVSFGGRPGTDTLGGGSRPGTETALLGGGRPGT